MKTIDNFDQDIFFEVLTLEELNTIKGGTKEKDIWEPDLD